MVEVVGEAMAAEPGSGKWLERRELQATEGGTLPSMHAQSNSNSHKMAHDIVNEQAHSHTHYIWSA